MAVQISGNDITVPRDTTVTRNLTVGGVLTYEDVTNVDSVGLVTARTGIEIGARPGVAASISVDGNAIFSGITTVGGNIKVGSGITLSPDGDVFTTGVSTVKGIHINGTLEGQDLKVGTGVTITRDGDIFATGISTFSEGFAGDVIIDDKIVHRGDTDTAIRFAGVNTITAETAGSERVRITSDGRLLINSTAARNVGGGVSRLIEVESSGGGAGISIVRNQNTASPGTLDLGKSRGYPHTIVQDDDKLGIVNFCGADGTDLQSSAAQIVGEVDGTPGENDMPGRLIFKTTADGSNSPTERLRITSNGQLLIGGHSTAHNSAYKIDIQTDTTTHLNGVNVRATALQNDTLLVAALAHATPSGAATNRRAHIGVYRNGSSQPGGYVYMHQQDGGNTYIWPDSSNVLRIGNALSNVTNDAGTVVGSQTSDVRLKNVLGDVTYGLAEINKINPIQFNFKNDKNVQKRIGFSAQDLQSIIPESVYNTKNIQEVDGVEIEDVLGMEYAQITPVLVNAVKELSTEIDKLKAEIAALKSS